MVFVLAPFHSSHRSTYGVDRHPEGFINSYGGAGASAVEVLCDGPFWYTSFITVSLAFGRY